MNTIFVLLVRDTSTNEMVAFKGYKTEESAARDAVKIEFNELQPNCEHFYSCNYIEELVAAYCEIRDLDVSDYNEYYNSHKQEIQDDAYEHIITNTWGDDLYIAEITIEAGTIMQRLLSFLLMKLLNMKQRFKKS